MAARLRIGVMGAGSIGCFVGGRLAATGAADVVLVGRPRIQAELREHGLTLEELDGPPATVRADQVDCHTEVAALASCDVILCCVKSAHTAEVARELDGVLPPEAIVISLQNGVRNPEVLRAALGDRLVLAAIVGFNVVSKGGGVFRRATNGPIMIEASTDPRARAAVEAMAAALEVEVPRDLAAHQWTKLAVNLNNAVSALSDAPTRDLILVPMFRKVVAAILSEALAVFRAAGVRHAALRGIPLGVMPAVLRLPTPLVRLVTRRQLKVDPEARSSMWEDLTRRRTTEVDYLNGEIVRLAERAGVDAPVNRRIVELVRAAEAADAGPPGHSAGELWRLLCG